MQLSTAVLAAVLSALPIASASFVSVASDDQCVSTSTHIEYSTVVHDYPTTKKSIAAATEPEVPVTSSPAQPATRANVTPTSTSKSTLSSEASSSSSSSTNSSSSSSSSSSSNSSSSSSSTAAHQATSSVAAETTTKATTPTKPATEATPTQSPQADPSFVSKYLDVHNELRTSMENTNPVTWNAGIADVAQKVADGFSCGSQLVHSHSSYQGQGLGENLAYGFDFNSGASINAWFNEIHLYDYSKPGFYENTGHFTQLVWASTTQIGCGYKVCPPEENGVYVVCEYMPQGNVILAGDGVTDPNIFFEQNVNKPKDKSLAINA